MIVGVLGILKAGGAYVPLDPDVSRPSVGFHPEHRVRLSADAAELLRCRTGPKRALDLSRRRAEAISDQSTSEPGVCRKTVETGVYHLYVRLNG